MIKTSEKHLTGYLQNEFGKSDIEVCLLNHVFITSKIWLLLRHFLLAQSGQFPAESGRMFPPESVVSLRRNKMFGN